MGTFLLNYNILSIPLAENPLISVNMCVKKWKENSQNATDVEMDDILIVGNLENCISIGELKNYFCQYGSLKDFKYLEQKDLTKNFKMFASCAYITYVEKHIVDEILLYTFSIEDFSICPPKAPYHMKIETNMFLKNIEEYYQNTYNLYNGRTKIIGDIQKYNKMNLRKKIKNLVDEDGFTVVQGTATAVEFYDSFFFKPTEQYNCIVRIKKQSQNKKIHTNLYLFKSKDMRKMEENATRNEKSTRRKKIKKRRNKT